MHPLLSALHTSSSYIVIMHPLLSALHTSSSYIVTLKSNNTFVLWNCFFLGGYYFTQSLIKQGLQAPLTSELLRSWKWLCPKQQGCWVKTCGTNGTFGKIHMYSFRYFNLQLHTHLKLNSLTYYTEMLTHTHTSEKLSYKQLKWSHSHTKKQTKKHFSMLYERI